MDEPDKGPQPPSRTRDPYRLKSATMTVLTPGVRPINPRLQKEALPNWLEAPIDWFLFFCNCIRGYRAYNGRRNHEMRR